MLLELSIIMDNPMDIMMTACALCLRYDEWSNDESILPIINMETNSFCKSLKFNYSEMEDKIIQSISLAYSLSLYTICNNENING